MNTDQEPASDYTRSRVPDHATIGGFRIAVVVFGIGVTLPIFYIGSEISLALGLRQATLALFGGCAIVGLMMIVTSIIGARTRLSTYMIIQFSFGPNLVRYLVNPLLAMTYVGYFAATGDIFGGAIRDAVNAFYGIAIPRAVCAFIGCVAMSLTAMYGFRFIERFSSLAVPLLALFMLYVVYLVLQRIELQDLWTARGSGDMSVGLAISTVVGANILMAVSGPDLTRYARSGREGVKSVTGLAAGYPLIMLAAGIPALAFAETDIMKIMVIVGVALPAMFILVFSTWTTNTVNLYSAVLTLAASFRRFSDKQLAMMAGALGTLGAVLGIMDVFLPFVLILGIAATPIAGVYIADFFLLSPSAYRLEHLSARPSIGYSALFAWIAGTGTAAAAHQGLLTLTTVPAADGMITAFLLHTVLARWVFREKR
ncbi:MAG: cytosine permease [Gammaproteobacteria bacterium]|nr:cytosine permease [Gammaproteobacteria bacterium]